jgi:integrase
VLALLSELNLHAYDPEWFIFSSSHHKIGFKDGTFFPGPKAVYKQTPTTWWRDIVKAKAEKGGLGLDVSQYGLKKLSGNNMVRMQKKYHVDKLLDLPQSQMGHTNPKMTEVYVTEHLEIMKDLVKEHMPVL